MNRTHVNVSPDVGCPHLGYWEDPATSSTFANRAHYCFCIPHPQKPPLNHQAAFCITGEYHQCAIYQRAEDIQALEAVFGRINLAQRIRLLLMNRPSEVSKGD